MSKHTDEQVLEVVARYLSDSVYQHVADRIEQRSALLEALQWYVENDDTNIGQPGNEFWELGLERGRAAIALAQGDAA